MHQLIVRPVGSPKITARDIKVFTRQGGKFKQPKLRWDLAPDKLELVKEHGLNQGAFLDFPATACANPQQFSIGDAMTDGALEKLRGVMEHNARARRSTTGTRGDETGPVALLREYAPFLIVTVVLMWWIHRQQQKTNELIAS